MRTAVKKTKKKISYRRSDLPTTQGMLKALEEKLTSQNRASQFKNDAQFKSVDARFKEVHARFNEVDARFNEIDARFNEIDARFNEIDARFNEIDARFNKIDARFDRTDARFNEMDAKFNRLEGKIETLTSYVSQMAMENEAQRAENRIVLEGIAACLARQDRVEKRMDEVELTVKSLAKRSSRNL